MGLHLQGRERAKRGADAAALRRLQRGRRQVRAALEEAGGGAVCGRGRPLRVAAAARLSSKGQTETAACGRWMEHDEEKRRV